MYKEKKVSIVVPAYNEEKFIAQVIRDVPSFVDSIIVIDDVSQDSTCERVQELSDPRVLLLKNTVNDGVGGSTIRGYQRALELGSEIIVKVDGDGQMPLDRLHSLLDTIIEEGYVYAKGNRFLDQELAQMPKSRLIGNVILTFLTKLASGYWHIFDPQNGYTAIDAHALRTLDLDRIHQRFFFENDMLVQLNPPNFRVKDVPMPAIYGEERSSISITSILLSFPVLLLRRYCHRIYQKYVLLAYFLRKKLGYLDGRRIIRSSAKIIFASSVMGVVYWIGMNLSEPFFADVMALKQQILQVGGLVLVGGLAYFAVAFLLRAKELAIIRQLSGHLFPRR